MLTRTGEDQLTVDDKGDSDRNDMKGEKVKTEVKG
jgi:hypothetical protein